MNSWIASEKFMLNVGDLKLKDLDGKTNNDGNMLPEIDVNLFILQRLHTSFENIQFSLLVSGVGGKHIGMCAVTVKQLRLCVHNRIFQL